MTRDWTCARCRTGEILAVLRLPRSPGTASEIPICTTCEADDPLTAPIITYFTVHGTATPAHAHELAALLHPWLTQAKPPTPNLTTLEAETQSWHHGTL